MMSAGTRLLLGVVLSGAMGLLAYWRGSLTGSGALGALLVGTAIFGFGGPVWGLLLIAFFVSSSLLSKVKEAEKERIAGEKFAKGGRRDIWQALANAGAGSLIAAAAFVTPLRIVPLWFAAFIGAMATVNADTWATELGVLSKQPPRLITTLQPVEPGTSGGVTVRGTLATLGGGLFIGLMAALLMIIRGAIAGISPPELLRVDLMLAVGSAGGFAGSLFDSLLGATVQGIYVSDARDTLTERPEEADGTPNRRVRGWRWLTNDMVNFISSLVGAGVAAGLWALLLR